MSAPRWALYGATGYTGQLIVDEAVRRGLKPLLMGRSEEKLRPLAERHGLPFKAVPLEDPGSLRAALEGQRLVLHAAGPFVETSAPMVRACLDLGAHYLDITGELPVFEAIFALDEEARRREVTLLPGVGFDVVPSDCLALHAARRVRNPRRLLIALAAIGHPSGGTAASAVGLLPAGVRVRRNGALRRVAPLRGGRRVRFSRREAWVIPAPLADLETAFHSTGIGDITTYLAVPKSVATAGRALWPVAAAGLPLLRAAFKVPALREKAGELARRRTGPDAQQRERGRSYLWARVEADDGEWAESVLETVEGYTLTAITAVRCVERVLAGSPSGASSPAQLFGPDFILEVPGTTRSDR